MRQTSDTMIAIATAASTTATSLEALGIARTVSRGLAFVAIIACAAAAQEKSQGATITGTVLDSAQNAILDADVVVHPGNHRTKSDSSGRFRVTGLDGGSYRVLARKVGYVPDRWELKLSDDGRMDVRFKLAKLPPQL